MNNSILFGLGALPKFSLDTTARHEFSKLSLKYTKKIYSVNQMNTTKRVHQFLLDSIYSKDEIEYRESGYALYLDNNLNVVGYLEIGKGGQTGVVMDVKMILAGCILSGANHIILTHNHPSGKLIPSNEDIELTQMIAASSKLMFIKLLDHIIITKEGMYSFAESGKL